ncbi:MAG: TrkH family potassium uptake protein [Bacteroidales bacterium]|jgi:trk system potassium uptake protein TrkH|nr:TrkH family potassium uptake protein [Bacteroidales bacterium]
MRKEIVIRHIGMVLIFNAIFLFISFLISLYLSETSVVPLLYSSLIALVFGLFPLIYVKPSHYISIWEGTSIVVFGWITTCLVGSLPYILWGGEFSFINAWFESVSGFTTTGSTIINDIEILPKGLLFWRSSTHWLGGIGIILFTILILPGSNTSKLVLLNTEMSPLAKSNFKFRSREILRILLYVYLGLTILETILLNLAGMSFFDAINHSFATIATGGFSTKNLSIAYYNSISIEVIIMVFMVFSGVHFGLTFNTILGNKNNIFKSSIFKAYITFLLVGVILVSLKLYFSDMYPWWESVRYAAFQVISLGTTTGFATIDTANWPSFTQIILIYFTIQCAMIGSTSGGLKFDRIFIYFKAIKKQIKSIQHPHAVIPLKVDGNSINEKTEIHTMIFIILYLGIIFITTALLTYLDVDNFTAFSSSAATIGNVGPGFGNVSSLGNYSNLPDLGKFFLTINMLLGRLEIFGIISLLFIKSWR